MIMNRDITTTVTTVQSIRVSENETSGRKMKRKIIMCMLNHCLEWDKWVLDELIPLQTVV